ncbi:MAG: ABC transporter ATP-binding protein [Candidatus Aminicenantes bacterium]|nr:ABC transporter ATP-binding protein [Candidatus Aminicenantes bacterium]
MSHPENRPVLSLKNVSKSYGDVKAVQDLSLDIRSGEIFGFLGPNGAGKTTTISMICGLLRNDSGDIFINGFSLKKFYKTLKPQIGLCPQDLVIWESLTCLEQLVFVGRQYDLNAKDSRRRSLELLDILGLENKKNRRAKTLSGGMKRRLNIALALVHDPEIVILDEPQAGLDPQSRVLVRDYVRSIAGRKTIILTTHDMNEADLLSDRVAIIDYGRLLVLDTLDNLKNRIGKGEILEIKIKERQGIIWDQVQKNLPDNLSHLAFQKGILHMLGDNIPEALPSLLQELKNHDLQVEDIKIRKKTLEDVFISLTGRGLRE